MFEKESFPWICKSYSWKRHDVPSRCQYLVVLQSVTRLQHVRCAAQGSAGQPVILFGSIRCIATTHGRLEVTAQSLKLGISYKCDRFLLCPFVCCFWFDPAFCWHTAHSLWSSAALTHKVFLDCAERWCLSHILLFPSWLEGWNVYSWSIPALQRTIDFFLKVWKGKVRYMQSMCLRRPPATSPSKNI